MLKPSTATASALRTAIFASLIYFVGCYTYIIVSSSVAAERSYSVSEMLERELFKGVVFSIVTAVVTFVLVFLAVRRLQIAYSELHQSHLALSEQLVEKERLNRDLLQAKALNDEARHVKNRFLANISHELRTPLHGIIGMTELLSESQLDESARERVQTIRSSSAGLLTIVSDLLDLTTIASGKYRLVSAPFLLRESLLHLEGIARLRSQVKSLRFSMVTEGNVDVTLHGDANRLRQSVLNLIENATKFTEPGGSVEVSVVAREDGERVELIIAVRDTGIGFPPEEAETLFLPFTQHETTDSRRFGGVGLGLSIARELVTMMGGTIQASSKMGEGSTFTIHLSLPHARMAVHTDVDPPSSFVRGGRALVVEDNAVNRRVAESILNRAGFTVRAVENGAVALAEYQIGFFDLVVMDVQMPVMDGLESTRAIRELERKANVAAVPVLAMTACAMPDDRQRCLDAGMTASITKPFIRADFLAIVKELTQSKLRWEERSSSE